MVMMVMTYKGDDGGLGEDDVDGSNSEMLLLLMMMTIDM